MNERINKLANEAWISVKQRVGFNDYERQILFEEKFAELIVKETLQVAKAGMEYGPSMEDAVYNYFGVEE